MTALSEDRLRWQSRLPVLAVIVLCAAAIGLSLAASWTQKTAPHSAEIGLLISAALAWIVWRTRAATPAAACAGGLLTSVVLLSPLSNSPLRHGLAGRWLYSGLAPLFPLILLTFAATKFGQRRRRGLRCGAGRLIEDHRAEDARGRSASQVVANLGVAALAACVPLTVDSCAALLHTPALSPVLPLAGRAVPLTTAAGVALVAAFAEAAADTVASEMGEALGGEPFLLTTGARVEPGTDGAVSAAGTGAGIAGATLVVLAGVCSLALAPRSAWAAGGGALCGFFFDSLLGATLERRGWINNDLVNFLSTCAAAVFAIALLS